MIWERVDTGNFDICSDDVLSVTWDSSQHMSLGGHGHYHGQASGIRPEAKSWIITEFTLLTFLTAAPHVMRA